MTIARAAAGVAALGLGCFGWGLIEARLFTLRRVRVPVLPAGGRELRVLHLSDAHLVPSQRAKLRFLRSLAHLKPDLVLNTGDNITDDEAIAPLMAALAPLRDVPGGFVFGSNDYHAPQFKSPLRYVTRGRSHASQASDVPPRLDAERLRTEFTRTGAWHDLNDRRAVVEVGGYRIELRGTDDAHHNLDRYDAVAGPATPGVDLSIGVTHAPYRRILDAMTADGVELIFAGHTHGGQVCVPLYGALTTNCDLPAPKVKGLSHVGDGGHRAWLHVSAGLGTSPFAPYRFACRPEATLVTLIPQD